MASVTTPPRPAPPEKRYSVDEYLDLEAVEARRADGCKIEYVAGEIRRMSGASRFHNLISLNLTAEIRRLLKGRPEEGYPGDMRVRPSRSGPYYYPDMVIACAPPDIHRDRGDTLLNPLAIFEIISPTTESTDRVEKLANYAQIETLQDYVMISQKEVRVDHLTRNADGTWKPVELRDVSAKLTLAGIDIGLELSELYDRIKFDPPEGAVGAE